MANKAGSSFFSQKHSISRKLFFSVLAISLFLIFEFAGLFLSSRRYLSGLTDMHSAVKAASLIRQIRTLLPEVKTAISNQQFLPTYLDKLNTLMQEILNLTAENPAVHDQLLKAQDSLKNMNDLLHYYFLEPSNQKANLLVIEQLYTEADENIAKAQIAMYNESDAIFNEIYAARFNPLIIGIILTTIFLGFVIWQGFHLTHQINRSIRSLLQATKTLAEGDLSVRAPIYEQDEIGRLTDSFNQMADSLQETTVSKESLTNVNKELEAFSYSVSHDLRSPLRAADGFSLALLEDYADKIDETGKNYLIRIRTSIQKMGKLIDDILNLSRLSRAQMNMKEVNLSELVESICKELTEMNPQRKVKCIIAPDVVIIADFSLIRIVLENLLGNAWKYTSKHETAQIEFGVQEQDGKKVYFISDDGAGFDMKYADKLFGPFQRLHAEHEFPGTGIGLATVKRIIYRHGGEVWAKGEIEKGTTIYFTLGTDTTNINV